MAQVEGTNKFKIGISVNPKRRLRQLQTGNPDRLILRGTKRGGRREEQSLHRALTPYRIKGSRECYLFPDDIRYVLQMTGFFSDFSEPPDDEIDYCQLSLFDED